MSPLRCDACPSSNREIVRRTRVAALFPNEDALLRLATAVLGEIDEDWATGKIYLSMKP